MTINFFEGFLARQVKETTLEQITERIRQDVALQRLTALYRAERRKEVKEQSPVFAVAARFYGGKQLKHVTALTGLTMVDMDHVPPKAMETLRRTVDSDPHTLLAYTTISGEGLRIVCRYEQDTSQPLEKQKLFYRKAFLAVNEYYQERTGVETDRQCGNVTRLSGIAHDPHLLYRPDAVPFSTEEILARGREQEQRAKAQRRMQREVDRIGQLYHRELAGELAREGADYTEGHHNDYIMRLGYKLNEFGFSIEAAVAWGMRQFGDYAQLEQVFRSCYRHTEAHHTRRLPAAGEGASSFATVDDIRHFLNERVELRHNELTARVEYREKGDDEPGRFRNMNDRMLNTLWCGLSERGYKTLASDIARVIDSDFTPTYHPLRSYLEALPPWQEGHPDYLRQLADTVTVEGDEAEQERFFLCLRKWLVGMVAAWMVDDVVNNVILVLIGRQGSYKTTWFAALLPPQLRNYFHTRVDSRKLDKDEMLKLASYALVCCEELDAMQRSEVNQLKAAVTVPSIDERAAYARYHEHRQHIASFCGTGNNIQFLCDPTGSRRWLPFEVASICPPREQTLPYEGIYSQAYALFRSGFRYWFTQEEIVELNRHNTRFEVPQLEKELALLYFRMPTESEPGQFMPTARIMQHVSANIGQKLSPVLMGRALVDLGFERVKVKGIRGFIVIPRTGEEILAYQKSLVLPHNRDWTDGQMDT